MTAATDQQRLRATVTASDGGDRLDSGPFQVELLTDKSTLEKETTIQIQEHQPKQVSLHFEIADEELHKLLLPNIDDLPPLPPSAIETNFISYFATDFIKPGHDQYVYRHANGLCVIGLASTHIAFKDEGGVTGVDFNVGKSDRSGFKVTGKRKKNAQHFETNTALCKICTKTESYIVRCCVKGSLLEVNDRLIKQPELLNALFWGSMIWSANKADREGYIAIMMPKPADWQKVKTSLLSLDEYKKLRAGS